MESIFHSLLMLMLVVWVVAVVMRKIGLPTIMGELVMGVVIGPAVLGWVTPNEVIITLAHIELNQSKYDFSFTDIIHFFPFMTGLKRKSSNSWIGK